MVISAIPTFVFHALIISLLPLAKSFEEVQGAVAELIKDRIVVGHAIQNDLKVCIFPPSDRRTNPLLSSGSHVITSAGPNPRHANPGSPARSESLCSTSSEESGE